MWLQKGKSTFNIQFTLQNYFWYINIFLLGPIKGMKCTYIVEAEPYEHSWSDNFLCIPNDAPFDFDWSLAGPIRGKKCIQWMEPADPHTWSDNFLCM